MRWKIAGPLAWMVLLGAAACKGTPTVTDPPVDCSTEGTALLSSVQVPNWPAGLEAAIDELNSLDGRWTAMACDTQVNVSIRTPPPTNTGALVEIVTEPLPAGNDCGCTIDTSNPKDGDLTVIARTEIDVFVQNYPNAGFRDEAAGNVAGLPVALYADASGILVRGCTTKLVPPILGLPWTDTDFVFRAGSSGIFSSGTQKSDRAQRAVAMIMASWRCSGAFSGSSW